MSNGKFTISILGLLLAIFASCNFNMTKVKENFGGLPSRTWKVDRVTASSQQAAVKGDFYSVPGTYQAMLNPRFSNTDFGANIRYNMPSHENQATPCDPLTFGSMAKENYTNSQENYCGECNGGCSPASCGKGGVPKSFSGAAKPTQAGYAGGNYNEVLEDAYLGSTHPDVSSSLPVGDMTTLNSLGGTEQVIIQDRYMYANRNSRLRSQGDPIRGDLPIVPCTSDWFRPSVHPNIDLHQGAMNTMGGIDNSTSNALAELIYTSSGKSATTIGGVNMAAQLTGSLSAGLNDVQITAFP